MWYISFSNIYFRLRFLCDIVLDCDENLDFSYRILSEEIVRCSATSSTLAIMMNEM